MKFILVESIDYKMKDNKEDGKIEYRPMRDKDSFNKFAKEAKLFFKYPNGSPVDPVSDFGDAWDGYMSEIYKDGNLIGYVSMSDVFGEEGEGLGKALDIGNLIILDRGKGLGTEVIKDIVNNGRDKYDTIYCYVDADNNNAVRFYKRLGTVYDEEGPNDNNEYFVTLYPKSKTDYFSGRMKTFSKNHTFRKN